MAENLNDGLCRLTDTECDTFRRLPLSFIDMVRTIHADGWNKCHKYMAWRMKLTKQQKDLLERIVYAMEMENHGYNGIKDCLEFDDICDGLNLLVEITNMTV